MQTGKNTGRARSRLSYIPSNFLAKRLASSFFSFGISWITIMPEFLGLSNQISSSPRSLLCHIFSLPETAMQDSKNNSNHSICRVVIESPCLNNTCALSEQCITISADALDKEGSFVFLVAVLYIQFLNGALPEILIHPFFETYMALLTFYVYDFSHFQK